MKNLNEIELKSFYAADFTVIYATEIDARALSEYENGSILILIDADGSERAYKKP